MSFAFIKPLNSSFDEDKAKKAIASALEDFYESLIAGIDKLDVDDILKKKNPYLFRAKDLKTAQDIVKSILDAYISSSEETIFGNLFFEPLAIAVSGGSKSLATGIDLELEKNAVRTAIAVKSGTSVFNSDSKAKQRQNFEAANGKAREGGLTLNAVIGYAYGTTVPSSRSLALELAGEDFWEYLTGDSLFYKKIIEYMGDKPEEFAKRFEDSKARALNRMVKDFTEKYVKLDGSIDWDLFVDYNSGSALRKEAEAHESLKSSCLVEINTNPSITKKELKARLQCSDKKLNTVLSELIDANIISKGHDGKKRGWTVI